MAELTFDVAVFRQQFPAFADSVIYPDPQLEMWWGIATDYISKNNTGYLKDASRSYALNLMTAHLQVLSTQAATGEDSGVMQSAGIDKISVSLVPPPIKNGWQYWLNQTTYGKQLLALLSVKGVGGLYIGGLPEKSAFRKVYGVF